MKSYFFTFCYCLVAISVLTSGCKRDDKKGEGELPPMNVDVAEVEVDSVMVYKEYPGHLRANSIVDIVARVDGVILSKNYVSGDLVPAGKVLFTIDPTQYQNAVEQAQGQLDNAVSTNAYASRQYEAMKKALESNAVSEMEVLQAKSNYEESLASIKTYTAALESAKTNLGYCTIKAPFTGRVSLANYSVGGYVAGSAAPVTLASLYDNSLFWAEFYIEASAFIHIMGDKSNEVKNGYESIPINFEEPLKHDYLGSFNYVSPDVDTGTGTMLIRAQLENKWDELRDGMYVTVSLPYQYYSDAILVEDAAIGTDQAGKYVYVVNDKDEVVYTPIKIGALVKGTKRIVTEGLEAGQKYVTKALLKVRNGTKVKPVENKN